MRSPQGSFRRFRFQPFHIISAVFAFLLILATGAMLAAQQQQNRYERPKCWGCSQPTPSPTPKPSPKPTGNWEPATNCRPISLKMTNDDDKILLRCTIEVGDSFKIKVSKGVSSANSRQGDFVQFAVAQDVRSSVDPLEPYQRGRVIIQKDSPAFGIVLERKHRHFPFTNGKLNVSLGAVTASDGTPIPVYIDRFRCPQCLSCLFKEGKTCDSYCFARATTSDQAITFCGSRVERQYVSGRADRVVSPVIAALAGTALAFINKKDDPTVKAYILFTLVQQTGIPDLLNGTDAELREGEIFDAYVTQKTEVVIEASKPVLANKW